MFPFVLAWASDKAEKEVLSEMLSVIPPALSIPRIYRTAGADPSQRSGPLGVLQLLGLICFYGRHYVRYTPHRVSSTLV